ncbi:MAG TPA: ABC transporter ATP-binding protein [Vicinamibacterales bacterium]|nr:ABC transporter ATP-binding protein [Vicinamibacterales bacterium]
MLEITNVCKSFGRGSPVLDSFSLTVKAGEFVSLIGPSGCGKTTLLRIVAGLLPASSGSVKVNGKESNGPSRDKAVVFQHFNLFPWRTALANAAYGLEIHGVGKKEREERALRWLAKLGLEKYAHHYPSEISGGMRQRVGIARALAIEPKLLLMDEPFGALDALTREHLQGELQRIGETTQLTILFVTHSIDEAIYLSDRIVAMGTHPGRTIREFQVELRRPRYAYNFRAEPSYAQIRGEIWKLLERELSKADEESFTASSTEGESQHGVEVPS